MARASSAKTQGATTSSFSLATRCLIRRASSGRVTEGAAWYSATEV